MGWSGYELSPGSGCHLLDWPLHDRWDQCGHLTSSVNLGSSTGMKYRLLSSPTVTYCKSQRNHLQFVVSEGLKSCGTSTKTGNIMPHSLHRLIKAYPYGPAPKPNWDHSGWINYCHAVFVEAFLFFFISFLLPFPWCLILFLKCPSYYQTFQTLRPDDAYMCQQNWVIIIQVCVWCQAITSTYVNHYVQAAASPHDWAAVVGDHI